MAFAATRLFYNQNPGASETPLQQVQERLNRAIRRAREEGSTGIAENACTDLAILEILTAPALGVNLPLSQPYREYRPLDLLSIQHLLKVLEICWLNGRKKEKNTIYKTLNPLSGLLIGDLHFFKQLFGDWLLYSWQELLGFSLPVPHGYILPDNEFIKAWVRWRHVFTANNAENELGRTGPTALTQLAHSAEGEKERNRVKIESAYLAILQGCHPDTVEWQDALFSHRDKQEEPVKTKPIAIESFSLAPIMKALTLPFYEAGQPSLSYRCLTSIAAPSSTMSSLERVSQDINGKQFVLADLGLERSVGS